VDTWTFALHCLIALGLGLLIGIERQWTQHPAGLRTNALVSLGAALFVGLSLLETRDSGDRTRIAAQVVSGLGFLGGGVILREGLNVRGLNTAATIWCSGAVGSLAGGGVPVAAVIGAACVLFVHLALRPVVLWIDARKMAATQIETYYRLHVECEAAHEIQVRTILLRHIGSEKRMSLHSLSSSAEPGGMTAVSADLFSLERNDRAVEEIVARASIEPEVKVVRWERG
jgi:putative Mg2+ transporter-C (MgtC) family protein